MPLTILRKMFPFPLEARNLWIQFKKEIRLVKPDFRSHVWLTSVKEGFVVEVIYSTTQVHTKKWNVNMKTKTVSFSLVAIKFPFGLLKYWKEYFLIPLIGLNWSVCLTFSVESLGKFYCFSKAESTNIQLSSKYNPALTFKTINSNNDSGVFKINDFQDWYLWMFSFWMWSEYKKVPASNIGFVLLVEVEPPWIYF